MAEALVRLSRGPSEVLPERREKGKAELREFPAAYFRSPVCISTIFASGNGAPLGKSLGAEGNLGLLIFQVGHCNHQPSRSMSVSTSWNWARAE